MEGGWVLNDGRSSRRGLLAAGFGGAVALAAQALGRPAPAQATHAGYVQIDHNNSTAGTFFMNSSTANFAGLGSPENAVLGLLFGAPNTAAVKAETGGVNSQVGLDADSRGGNGEGISVRARTKNGIGVYAEATGGYALQVSGRAVFNRSGRAKVAAGTSSKTVEGFAMTAATLVIATVQGNPAGVWVRNVSINDAQDTFTIRLNKAAPSGGVLVAFFIVN